MALTTTKFALVNGNSYYAVFIRNEDGHAWNGAANEAIDSTHWTSYAVALVAVTGTPYFTLTAPALPAGTYTVTVYLQAGGSAAVSDTVVKEETMYEWDGSSRVLLASRAAPAAQMDLVNAPNATAVTAIAASILSSTANKLLTDASGYVTAKIAANQDVRNVTGTITGPVEIGTFAASGSADGTGNLAVVNQDFTVGTAITWASGIVATGLVSTSWTKFVLTLKRDPTLDSDDDALVAVRITNGGAGDDGLITIKGQPVASGQASLASVTVSGITPDTTVIWSLAPEVMDQQPTPSNAWFAWELTRWKTNVKEVIAAGRLKIVRTVRRDIAAP